MAAVNQTLRPVVNTTGLHSSAVTWMGRRVYAGSGFTNSGSRRIKRCIESFMQALPDGGGTLQLEAFKRALSDALAQMTNRELVRPPLVTD